MTKMVERNKWILYKHTSSYELIKAVALDVKTAARPIFQTLNVIVCRKDLLRWICIKREILKTDLWILSITE